MAGWKAGVDVLLSKSVKSGGRWKPIYNKNYWYVDNENIGTFRWVNGNFDNYQYKINNCFRTKVEAQRKCEIDILIEKNRWYPSREELEDDCIEKHFIQVDSYYKSLENNSGCEYTKSTIIYKSKEACQNVIDNITYDEYLKYVLCVY